MYPYLGVGLLCSEGFNLACHFLHHSRVSRLQLLKKKKKHSKGEERERRKVVYLHKLRADFAQPFLEVLDLLGDG